MQWIAVSTPPFTSLDQVAGVMSQMDGEPEGLEARYIGTADGAPRIVTVWESKAHADRFFAETLGPILAKTLGPEPMGKAEIVGIEVARSYVRQPVG